MKPQRIDTERLQAMLDYANEKARAEDCIHRLELRGEVAKLQNATRIGILRALGGDYVGL
jgi:hypothetical protein